ncbi:MAG: serine hydrolase, partial [Pseudomonadota bacterium]
MYRSSRPAGWFRVAAAAGLWMSLTACDHDPAARIDALFSAYAGDDTPGAAVLVIRNGDRIVQRGYGTADLEQGTPVEPVTNFRLASITKQFTATAIMLLVEEGALTLDTRLTTVFPDFNDYAAPITIKHLLQHQSGLPDYERLVPETATEQVHDRDVLTLMAAVDAGEFEPGTDYHYSNSGYAVLAMVVEKLSGQTFSQFLEERIFSPLGMSNTVAFVDGVSTVPNRALGYTVIDEDIQPSDQSLYSAVLGDGGIYASLNDLYRWDQALYTNALLSAASLALMRTPDREDYGFGWRIDRYRGKLRYHHSGSTSGFRNFMQQFP